MANGKLLLILALLFTVLGTFGVATSLLGAKLATLNGVAEVTGFRVGTAGAGLCLLAGLALLMWLWPKINIKQ